MESVAVEKGKQKLTGTNSESERRKTPEKRLKIYHSVAEVIRKRKRKFSHNPLHQENTRKRRKFTPGETVTVFQNGVRRETETVSKLFGNPH